MTFGWDLESIGIDFYLECVGMAHEMCWNVLEWPMEWAGMGWNGLEWVGMALGMALGMGWNGLEWVGMALGIWQNELGIVGMEFHLDSIGIWRNDRF